MMKFRWSGKKGWPEEFRGGRGESPWRQPSTNYKVQLRGGCLGFSPRPRFLSNNCSIREVSSRWSSPAKLTPWPILRSWNAIARLKPTRNPFTTWLRLEHRHVDDSFIDIGVETGKRNTRSLSLSREREADYYGILDLVCWLIAKINKITGLHRWWWLLKYILAWTRGALTRLKSILLTHLLESISFAYFLIRDIITIYVKTYSSIIRF